MRTIDAESNWPNDRAQGGDSSRHHFFTRSRKKKETFDHVGRTNNIQTFFEAPEFKESDPKWVEHAPPTLPQAKKAKQEGAAVQVFKRRTSGPRREEFYIHKVVLQSPYLRDALKDTLETNGITYRDSIFAESTAPHHGLFFALDHIAQLSQTADDEITRSHCEILCSVVEEIFDGTLDELEKLDAEQKITYDHVWTLFAPGSLFGTQFYSHPPYAYRVKRLEQDEDRLKLTAERVIFDGYRYGTMEVIFRVYAFEGTYEVSSMPDLPYINLKKNPEIRARLVARGRKALDMQTIQYMTFKPDLTGFNQADVPWVQEDEEQRVVIDPHLYRLRRAIWEVKPLPGYQKLGNDDIETDQEGMENEIRAADNGIQEHQSRMGGKRAKAMGQHKEGGRHSGRAKSQWREDTRRPKKAQIARNRQVVLQDEDNLVIMFGFVSGYSLETRTWDTFYIEHLHPVEVDETVFEKVVLDHAKKDIIKTLVESHKDRTSHYDDLIRGKGECLLVLLSGPPGTGKTLMAESLAEHLGSPLLRADPAYIQQDMLQVMQGYDASLGQFLKDATEWGALVLFDEPDFLFQTQEAGADRSDLLAFLRHAEYFKGIIFLTTNLGRSIDPAVISRAQIHLRFPALTRPLRVRVWENFVERLPKDVGTLSLTDIEHLAHWQVNGREIKNILNMSVSWCRKKKCQLTVAAIENMIRTICSSAKMEEGSDTNGINGVMEDESMNHELSLLEL